MFVRGSLNSTPVAFDQTVNTIEDVNNGSGVAIILQGQDPDGLKAGDENHTLTFSIVTPPAAGTGSLGSIGAPTCDNTTGVCSASVTYTPPADYNGSPSFTFKVNDGTANSNENGAVSINVAAVDDAPTFTQQG